MGVEGVVMSPSYQLVTKTEIFYQVLEVTPDLQLGELKASLRTESVVSSRVTVLGLANLPRLTTWCCAVISSR